MESKLNFHHNRTEQFHHLGYIQYTSFSFCRFSPALLAAPFQFAVDVIVFSNIYNISVYLIDFQRGIDNLIINVPDLECDLYSRLLLGCFYGSV